jgi:hypothetical protein
MQTRLNKKGEAEHAQHAKRREIDAYLLGTCAKLRLVSMHVSREWHAH